VSKERPEAEKNLGVFFNGPEDGSGGFLVPMDNLNVGPGQPGPEDEWQIPTQPEGTGADSTPEPAHTKDHPAD
jgi:hypothetical protein